jgi:hypothetical protein
VPGEEAIGPLAKLPKQPLLRQGEVPGGGEGHPIGLSRRETIDPRPLKGPQPAPGEGALSFPKGLAECGRHPGPAEGDPGKALEEVSFPLPGQELDAVKGRVLGGQALEEEGVQEAISQDQEKGGLRCKNHGLFGSIEGDLPQPLVFCEVSQKGLGWPLEDDRKRLGPGSAKEEQGSPKEAEAGYLKEAGARLLG